MVRNKKRRLMIGVAATLALVVTGVATAQQPSAGVSEFDAGVKPTRLSPAEQLDQAQGFVASMERTRDGIRRDLEEARNKGDVVKKLCLDDKLNQLDIALRKATEREKALQSAAKLGDVELSNHEYTILSVLNQRATSLDAEAKLCIGKEVVSVGDSSIQVDIEGSLPGEDATTGVPTPPLVVEPPACASCFK
jgi:hypothetical protein